MNKPATHTIKHRNETISVRPFDIRADSLEELTELLNRSYRSLADLGFRYLASWQDAQRTRERIKNAQCFVGIINEKIAATISYYEPQHTQYPPWDAAGPVAHFGQFAVDPMLQGKGIGDELLQFIERYAMSNGAAELALDTAEKAEHLVNYYTRRGYRFITHVQCEEVNYRSVILSKNLKIQAHHGQHL
jgi:GNAT superfamily N-acetyltransferase